MKFHNPHTKEQFIFAEFERQMKIKKNNKKITKNELADLLGIHVNTLIQYFKLRTPIPLTVYLNIEDILKSRKKICNQFLEIDIWHESLINEKC